LGAPRQRKAAKIQKYLSAVLRKEKWREFFEFDQRETLISAQTCAFSAYYCRAARVGRKIFKLGSKARCVMVSVWSHDLGPLEQQMLHNKN
jgi:hypothetical protein